jgi:hypothetical protein
MVSDINRNINLKIILQNDIWKERYQQKKEKNNSPGVAV